MDKNWFEATVRFERMLENGNLKNVSEKYLVEAINPSEAETRVTEIVSPLSQGEFSVKSIVEQKYQDIVLSGNDNADDYWCATIELVTLDEKSGKEKKSNFRILILAIDFNDASDKVEDFMRGSVMDYAIVKLERTKIIDVFTK